MNTLFYKGHSARVEFDAADRILAVHVVGINDVIGFHAETVEDLETAFHEALDDYIATCAVLGNSRSAIIRVR